MLMCLSHFIRYLLAVSLLCALALTNAEPARAGFAYAYAENQIADFQVLSATGILGVYASAEAEFGGFGNDLKESTTTPATPQAKSGPGPFPAEDSFFPQGEVGEYARADTASGGYGVGSFTEYGVAEAYRTSNGSADGFAYHSFTFQIEQTTIDPVTFTFEAAPYMYVARDPDDNYAYADLTFTLKLQDDISSPAPFLTWSPTGNPVTSVTVTSGSVSDVNEPFSLNTSIVPDATGTKTYAPAAGDPFTLSYQGQMGQTYVAIVQFSEYASVLVVPEPSTAVLGIVGFLMGVVAVRRRRILHGPAREDKRGGQTGQEDKRVRTVLR
jgi:hypothetical protein